MRYTPSLPIPLSLCVVFSLLGGCSQDDSQQPSAQPTSPSKVSAPEGATPTLQGTEAAASVKPVAAESKNTESPSVEVQNLNGMPSHCTANEKTYLSATIKKIKRAEGRTTFEDTDNVLSLCIKGENIIYRYGAIGSLDLEKVATPDKPFSQHFVRLGRIGMQRTYFSNGQYHYYVTESLGMGSGISIDVYHKEKQIADLFSGNDPEADFWLSTELQLPQVSLVEKKPIHKEMQ